MKNKTPLYSTCFLLIVGICHAQITTFQKVYGGTGVKQDYAYDMHKTTDGGYILGGVTENYPTGVRRSYLIKTDANGDTLWTSIFGDTCTNGNGPYPPQQYINDLAQTSDGGYITAGGMALCGAATSEGGEITRLDSSGNVLWSKTCSTGNEDPYPVIQCSDGNFIFGGVVSGIGAGGRDGCLTKIDATGDTLWSKTYGSPGNEWFYHILQTTDGGYLAAGETDYFGLGVVDTNNNIYLVKTDSMGNVQWSKAYGTAGGNQTAFGHCLQPTTDGGYIIAGAASSQITESDSGIFLMKIDATGNMKWSNYFSGCFGHAVKQTADNGYLIAGTGNYGTTGNKVVLIKTDSAGAMQWANTYGGTNTDNGWLLEIANDGGYLTGGWTTSFGNDAEHIYLIKTDENGNSACNETASAGVVERAALFVSSNAATQVMQGPGTTPFTPLFERAGTIINLCDTVITGINQVTGSLPGSFRVYPNPTSGHFTLNLSGPPATGTIEIYNMLGAKVYAIANQLLQATNEIDISGQPAGVYFVTVQNGTNTYGGKVVKE